MSQINTASTASKEKLVADMKVVIADAEEILKSTADVAGEKMASIRGKIEARLKDAKVRLEDAEAALVDKTKACARATDDFVHDQPWKAVGVAAVVGLALGVLIGRR
ncbi:DUF883 family protein [Azovibrio restrictus]|uniref:DUF883 family protein n=1 Tax=Azovibrio restrictus TaxID=146938 RepID=UPI00041D183A|nr:DUF883 family protein [Azovibrio restrictus]MCE1171022.1 DUF883 family protein [Azovibrio sp.]